MKQKEQKNTEKLSEDSAVVSPAKQKETYVLLFRRRRCRRRRRRRKLFCV